MVGLVVIWADGRETINYHCWVVALKYCSGQPNRRGAPGRVRFDFAGEVGWCS